MKNQKSFSFVERNFSVQYLFSETKFVLLLVEEVLPVFRN